MKAVSRGALIVGAGVLILSGLILFGTGGEDGTKESTLFKTNWEMIEYVPAADYYSEEEPTSDGTGDQKLSALPPKSVLKGKASAGAKGAAPHSPEIQSPEPEPKGRLALKFIRRPGLYRDQFEVLTPWGGVPGAREVRRRGAGTVRNIFTTWGKLIVKGIYSQAEAGDPVRLGLTGGAPRVLLFGSRARAPVTVILGRKRANGQMFIKSDQDGESLYLVPATEDFRNSYLAYRERRVLTYPAKSYTSRMNVRHAGQSVLLKQRRVEVKGTEQPEWTDAVGRTIANGRVTGLETGLKQVNISRFPDEPALRGYGDPEELWQQAGEPLVAEVAIHGGDVIKIEYRIPRTTISPGGSQLVLLRNSLDGTVDFADRTQYDALARALRDVVAEQKRLDMIEKARANPSQKQPGAKAPGSLRPALPVPVPRPKR